MNFVITMTSRIATRISKILGLNKTPRRIRKLGFFVGASIHVGKLTPIKELTDFLKELYPLKVNKNLIRVGNKGDGGYLIPDDLENIDALFSPGVGLENSFDLECAENGVKVFMADASVNGPATNHINFFFKKKFIGALDDKDYMSINRWIEESDVCNSTDLMLQMDIEGGEYEALYGISHKNINKFRIILVEFHWLDKMFDKCYFDNFKKVFFKLLQTHYVVHIHPNNSIRVVKRRGVSIPPVMEFTFIRKDRVHPTGHSNEYPNKLDFDCTHKKTLNLPKCWYKNN